MPVTLKKAVHGIAKVEASAAETYRFLKNMVEDPKVKEFFKHMVAQEVAHERKVEEFGESLAYDESLPGLNPEDLEIAMPPTLLLNEDTTFDEAINYVLDSERYLENLYNDLAERMREAGKDKFQRFFAAFALMEQGHVRELEFLKSKLPD